MNTRLKTLGAAAAFAAIAMSIPVAVNAYADDTDTTETTSIPVPVAKIPDPQGPGCGDYAKANPTGAGSFASMATVNASQAIAANPDLSDFSAAISGQWNPAVNLVSVLDNGPYNVFAPTDAAFAKMDPDALEALKADPAELTSVLYYHMALGYLGPDDIHGNLTTQQGRQITIEGKGGDLKFDGDAKVVCGGITAKGAKIYMIDTVLSPSDAPDAASEVATSTVPGTEETATEANAAESTATEPATTAATPGEAEATAPATTSAAPATPAA